MSRLSSCHLISIVGVNGRHFFQAGKPFIRLGSHLSGWEAICKAGKPLVRLGSHPGWEAVCQAGKHFYQAGKPQDSTCPSALIDSQSLGGFCLGMIYFPQGRSNTIDSANPGFPGFQPLVLSFLGLGDQKKGDTIIFFPSPENLGFQAAAATTTLANMT